MTVEKKHEKINLNGDSGKYLYPLSYIQGNLLNSKVFIVKRNGSQISREIDHHNFFHFCKCNFEIKLYHKIIKFFRRRNV